ncbi:unnamed protein product [Ectocarpus sp. 6 AP-2014]
MKPSQLAVDQAAGAGDIEICTLEWAHSRGLPGFQGLMDIAAWKGRLSVLKWLQANRNEGCTIKGTTWAAQSGHLKVLRWLRHALGQECTTDALEAAATAGRVRVVAWFLRNSGDQQVSKTPAVVAAASKGHVAVLKLLLSSSREEAEKSEWAIALASSGNHSECVELLEEAGWPARPALASVGHGSESSYKDDECPGEKPYRHEESKKEPSSLSDGENGWMAQISQVGGRRCSRWPFFGRRNTASSALRRRSTDVVRDAEGFFGGDWAEWERDWPAVGGIDHDDDEDCGCDECRLVAFLQATEPLAVGEKPRVRDVWTPVSADVPEAPRLNLGVLTKESQDTVISAYISGLLRGPMGPPAAGGGARYRARENPTPRRNNCSGGSDGRQACDSGVFVSTIVAVGGPGGDAVCRSPGPRGDHSERCHRWNSRSSIAASGA